jgi:hypothetical protein
MPIPIGTCRRLLGQTGPGKAGKMREKESAAQSGVLRCPSVVAARRHDAGSQLRDVWAGGGAPTGRAERGQSEGEEDRLRAVKRVGGSVSVWKSRRDASVDLAKSSQTT